MDNIGNKLGRGDGRDLGKRELEKHLLLIVDDVDARPVDGDDDVVLGQRRSAESIGLVETREEQRPLVHGVVDNVLFHFDGRHSFARVVALYLIDYIVQTTTTTTKVWSCWVSTRVKQKAAARFKCLIMVPK